MHLEKKCITLNLNKFGGGMVGTSSQLIFKYMVKTIYDFRQIS